MITEIREKLLIKLNTKEQPEEISVDLPKLLESTNKELSKLSEPKSE